MKKCMSWCEKNLINQNAQWNSEIYSYYSLNLFHYCYSEYTYVYQFEFLLSILLLIFCRPIISHLCRFTTCLSHRILFNYLSNIYLGVKFINVVIMLFVLCFYLPAGSKYSPRHPDLELPHSCFFTQCSKRRRITSVEVTCGVL